MKKITMIIVWMLFSFTSFAQFEIDYNYLNQQQKEIGSTIEADIKAQIREKMKQQQALEQQNQPQLLQNQNRSRQQQSQSTQQQALQDFNNKISSEGQQRMDYYNNPDNYINRSITNRRSDLNNTNSQVNSQNRYNSQNQYNDLRTRPIHSEELTSKSLQMLRDANREYFSNEDKEETINPNARVPLFDAPSLGVPLWQDLDEEMDMKTVYSELSPEQKVTYDKMKKEILERKENDLIKAEVLAELSKEIRSEMFASGAPDVAGAVYAIWAENIKENAIAREQKELRQLNELAREAVQNKRKK